MPAAASAPGRQYEADRAKRLALERELAELRAESERGKQVLDSLDEKISSLRAEVERQRRLKPAHCGSCRTVALQVDAAAQSLLGSAGHVARTLLRDANADRAELLETVLRYVEPVKHLDPDLESLYARASASLRGADALGIPHSEAPHRFPEGQPQAQGSMGSNVGAECPADGEVQALCDAVRDEALLRSREQNWGGTFGAFRAQSYRAQASAYGGLVYIIKVQVGRSEAIHLRVASLPGRGAPVLEGVRVRCALTAPLQFF